MALTVGDGPNRGKSAPSPRPLPRPRQDDGPRAETRREGTRQQALPQTRTRLSVSPDRLTDPIFRSLFDKDKASLDLPEKKPIDLGLKKRELPPERQDYDQVMAEVWGNLENEGAAGMMKRQRGESTLDPAQQRAQIVQNVADQMNVKAAIGARDQKRLAREAKDRTEKDKVLTAKEWARLTPMQQAAVQANSDLAEAISRDFKDQGKHDSNKDGDDSQFRRHESRVAELFGEDGRLGFKGLEYAPNTLSFLESRGIDKSKLVGKTLDDIVSGDALIDMDTVRTLEAKVPSDDPRSKNLAFAKNLAAGQLQYQENLAEKLKQGKELLTGLTGIEGAAKATESFGAKDNKPGHVALTKVRPETLGQFDIYLQALARSDSDPDKALQAIKADLEERGATPEESAQVWEGLIERTRQAATGEGLWFPGIDFPMRSPVEVAQKLGAPVLKRRGAQ